MQTGENRQAGEREQKQATNRCVRIHCAERKRGRDTARRRKKEKKKKRARREGTLTSIQVSVTDLKREPVLLLARILPAREPRYSKGSIFRGPLCFRVSAMLQQVKRKREREREREKVEVYTEGSSRFFPSFLLSTLFHSIFLTLILCTGPAKRPYVLFLFLLPAQEPPSPPHLPLPLPSTALPLDSAPLRPNGALSFSLPSSLPPSLSLTLSLFLSHTYIHTVRSPKTTAAAAENRCSTPYNHIVVLPSGSSSTTIVPLSLSFSRSLSPSLPSLIPSS